MVPGVDADACDRCVRAGAVEYVTPPAIADVMKHPSHDHRLRLSDKDTRCDVCGNYTEGVAYHCGETCNWGAYGCSMWLC